MEAAARIWHRIRYLTPFHSKRIGEYPFADLVEETDPPLFFRFRESLKTPVISLNRFCLFFLWRRMRKDQVRSNFSAAKGEIPRKACHENLKNNYRGLIKEAREMGASVACTFYATRPGNGHCK